MTDSKKHSKYSKPYRYCNLQVLNDIKYFTGKISLIFLPYGTLLQIFKIKLFFIFPALHKHALIILSINL